MDVLANKLRMTVDNLKKKPVLVYSMGCLLLFALSFFFTYYLRVIYSPAWLGQINGTLGIFGALWLVYTAFVLAARFAKNNRSLFMALLLLVLGVVWTFATPPNQVPDEHTHFLRSHQMAQGQWGFDQHHVFPDDVNSFIKHFPQAHNNGYPAKEGNTVYNRFVEYYDALKSGEKAENVGIIIFQVIPYIPGAVGIFLARLMGFGALGAFYGHRLANVAVFCFTAYFALKMAGKFRVIMFTLMSLPLMGFMYSSANSDSMLFALMFLMFGAVLSQQFDWKKGLVFAFSFAVLCTCKMSYIVFLPLVFCVPKEGWQVKVKDKNISRLVYLVFALVVFLIVYQGMGLYVSAFSNYGEIPRTMSDTDPVAQLIFILKNPLRYAAVFFDTLKNNAFFLFSGGVLGWLDVHLPLINYLTPVIVIFCCAKQAQVFTKEDMNKTAIFFVCGILTYAVAMTGLYLSWTPVTLPQIIGLQMRYVYPAFMGFAMAMGQYFSTRVDKNVKNTDFSCITTGYVFSLFAVVLMLIVYYLPERAVVFVA
ncbi:MAG: DUF2142 domain-containing protein [Oscillospiraceae bacterium]|nr:DUF2142 domain-containing protein [Oscillospiraceae bacterium]